MAKCRFCGKEHRYGRREALRAQAATPGRLRRLVAGLSAAQLRRRPAPRKWSIQEIALHLADVEIANGFRYRKAVAEPGSTLTPYDQDRWADGLNYRRLNLRAALEVFAALRKAHLLLLRGLSARQWRGWARHPEYGRYELGAVFLHMASHDLNHLEQIRALRRRWLRG